MTTATKKKQIAVVESNTPRSGAVGLTGPSAPFEVKVIKTRFGTVNWADKLKAYYKSLIALIAGFLVIVNELTPLLNFLPGQDKQYVTTAIVFVGTVLTYLKSNEHWVNDL